LLLESGPAVAAADQDPTAGGVGLFEEEDAAMVENEREETAEGLFEEKCAWGKDSAVSPFCGFDAALSKP
jgi:hypothetical protein